VRVIGNEYRADVSNELHVWRRRFVVGGASSLWHTAQEQQFTDGGTIAYATVDYIDMVVPDH